jgi:hypothetical protein
MKRAPLAAMLTLLATVAATIAIAGCGGKSSNTTSTGGGTTTTSTHKPASKAPGY